MRVVFTGRCESSGSIPGGNFRSEICRIAAIANIQVDPTVRESTDYLVASRTDTRKARRAEILGVSVITYEEFLNMAQTRRATHATPEPSGRMTPVPERDGWVVLRGGPENNLYSINMAEAERRLYSNLTQTPTILSGMVHEDSDPDVDLVADVAPVVETPVKKHVRRAAVVGRTYRALDL